MERSDMVEQPGSPGTAAEPLASAARPDGPAAAALIATGIGALVLALMVIVAEANEGFKESIAYSDRVGPLAGKTIWAVVAFAVSWIGLGAAFRGRHIDLRKAAIVAGALLALALVGTFSPFFELFTAE